jgi:hypothetical protein
MVAGCLEERDKSWDELKAKRGPRLGAAGVVVKVDNADDREAVRVRFDDGEKMWWRPEFLIDLEQPEAPVGEGQWDCLQVPPLVLLLSYDDWYHRSR